MRLLRRVHGRRLPGIHQILRIGRILSKKERWVFRVAVGALLVGVYWVGSDAVGAYRVQVPAAGGRYVEALVGSPKLINPVFASVNDVDVDISRLIFSGLLRYDYESRLVPDLAVRYDISEDKKTYTFELKKDVVWHDGEPFTARDVVFTIETIQNPDVGSPLYVTFKGVAVEAVGEYAVAFTLSEPFSPFLTALTVGILPEHRWAGTAPANLRLAQLNLQPVGTGPFMFKQLVKDQAGRISSYDLARFERFYRTPPHIQEFAFRFFSEYGGDDGAVAALRGYDVDGINFVPYHLRDDVAKKRVALHTMRMPQYSALFFNLDSNAFLGENNARSALAYAIDRDSVIRESVKSEGQRIEGPILPGSSAYRSGLPGMQYSIEEANRLLDAAWPRIPADEYRSARRLELLKDWESESVSATSTTSTDKDAERALKENEIDAQLKTELHEAQTFYRKNKGGGIVSLSLVTADTPEYRQAAPIVAGYWQDIGVRTTITYIAPKDMVRDALRGRKYDVLLYSVILGDPDQYPFWHSTQIDFPGLNLSRYVNRTTDGILQKIRETGDGDELVALEQKFEDQLLKDRPAVFLYMPTYTYATNGRVQGVNVKRITHPADRFSQVTDWYVETKGQWRWK